MATMNATEEVWRNISGSGGIYQVSSFGKVRSVDRTRIDISNRSYRMRGRVLCTSLRTDGYEQAWVLVDGKRISSAVHRLVALEFLPTKPSPVYQVNHIDGNKLNNCASNLEWVTGKENVQHAIKCGLFKRSTRL